MQDTIQFKVEIAKDTIITVNVANTVPPKVMVYDGDYPCKWLSDEDFAKLVKVDPKVNLIDPKISNKEFLALDLNFSDVYPKCNPDIPYLKLATPRWQGIIACFLDSMYDEYKKSNCRDNIIKLV